MAIDPFFGSVLAAAGNVAGGIVGGESSRKANENAAAQAEANRQAQLTMAQHGLYFRAKDAMHAYESTGIHPLALLGVQGPTYSPVSSAFTTSPLGEGIGRAGQDISRGLHATADRALREEALNVQRDALASSAERGRLENELLRIQIASERARLFQGPVIPSVQSNRFLVPGQGNTELRSPVAQGRLIADEPMKRQMHDPAQTSQEAGAVSAMGWLRNSDGTYTPVRSKDATERLEDDTLGNISWNVTNRFLPYLFGGGPPGPFRLPKGRKWIINWKGNYENVEDTRYRGMRTD